MNRKRMTVLAILLLLAISCAFAAMEDKQATTFRVKWSKTIDGTASIVIMDYEGNAALTGDNIPQAVIDLDPEDSTTPVPAFMIRHSTNIRGYHVITIEADKFKANINDAGYGYTMTFPEDSFENLDVTSDGASADLRFFVNSLNGEVDTDIKVDVIFTELDEMSGDNLQSTVTISCMVEV